MSNELCHTLGHAWAVTSTLHQLDTIQLELVCQRCATTRTDRFSPASGHLYRRGYKYPTGYLLAKGEERPTRDEFRLRLIAALRSRKKVTHDN